jgi:hypothetical protein
MRRLDQGHCDLGKQAAQALSGRSDTQSEQSAVLQSITATYRAVDAVLIKHGRLTQTTREDYALEVMLQKFMDDLLSCAAQIKASDIDGIASKLMLWRLDDPDFPVEPANLNRAQKVLLSLVQDLDELKSNKHLR